MRLFSFENIENIVIPTWVSSSYDLFKQTMTSEDEPFPCHFAKLGIENSGFRYSYINEEELSNPNVFKESLIHYLNSYLKLKWPSVLVVFIKTESTLSLSNHEKKFWEILQYLINIDTKKRPAEIPENPNNNKWQFCFNGTPIFITGHSNMYKKRKSRHSHSDMMLVIQTMETLKPVAGNSKKSSMIRKVIRDRVSEFDEISVTNLLGSYPDIDSLEWKQFWLPDNNDNSTYLDKCPLKL